MERRRPLRRRSGLKRTRFRRKPTERPGWDEVRAEVLAAGRCAAAGLAPGPCWPVRDGRPVLDPSHVLGRGMGGSRLADTPENVKPVCRGHHDWIHAHPRAAADLGLIRLRKDGPGQ